MTEILLGVIKGLGMIIGVLFLLSQLSWWLLGEKYFPSKRIYHYVRWNFPGWFAKERKFFKSHLADVTVFGFLSTILLVGIVPLNVSILAQVFSLFFPENEEMVIVPIIGEYMVFPLLIGLLYALVEIALSALKDYRKGLKQNTLLVTVTIIAMIIVEMGLNTYRSVIMAGNPAIARTFWDNLLGIGGPVLAGFLGFVVPLATVLLGAYAMMDFIMPMIQNIAVILHSTVLFTIYGLLVLLFGWQPKPVVEIPRQVDRLATETAEFKAQGDRLHNLFKQILVSFTTMNKLAKTLRLPVQEEVVALGESISRLEDKVASKKPVQTGNNGATYFPDISSKPDLKQAIEETRDEIRHHHTARESSKNKIVKISDKVVAYSRAWEELQAVRERYNTERMEIEQLLTSLEQGMLKLRIFEYCDAIDTVLRRESIQGTTLSKAECDNLLAQITAPRNASHQKKEMARAAADLSLKMVSEARSDLVAITKIGQDVRKWIDDNPNVDPTEDANAGVYIDNLKTRLVDFNNRLNLVMKTMDARFDAMQQNLVTLAWQLAAYITWIKLHASLRRAA